MSVVPARWRVLAAAAGMMLCIGSAYSWSLYARPLMALFGWTSLQVSFTFALTVFSGGVAAIAGGSLVDRLGPRRMGMTAAAMWGLGSILAGVGTPRFGLYWLYATYGVIGGLGSGLAFLIPGVTLAKWFPDRRGLANGIVLMAFGLGSLVFNDLVGVVPHFRAVADAAGKLIDARNAAIAAGVPFAFPAGQHTADIDVVMRVFWGSGIILFVVGVACAFGIVSPSEPADAAAAKGGGRPAYRWREMVRTPAFYALYAILFVDGFAGLSIIANAVPIYAELTASAASAATIVYGGLSVFNGIGRLLWAALSDTFGRRWCFAAALFLQACAIAGLAFARTPLTVMAALGLMLLCFGGIMAIAPATVADYYGTRFLGQDYGVVITSFSIAALAGPLLFGLLEDFTGSLTRAILPLAAVVFAATVLPLFAKRPEPNAGPALRAAPRSASAMTRTD